MPTRVDVPRVRRAPWERRLATTLVALDTFAVVLALVVAGLAGASLTPSEWWSGVPDDEVVAAVAVILVWLTAMALSGAYDVRSVGLGSEEYRRLAVGGLRALAAVVVIAFAANEPLERVTIFVVLAGALLVSGGLRQIARKQLHRRRADGQYARRVLVVGTAPSVRDVVTHLRRATFAGYAVAGACIPPGGSADDLADLDVAIVGRPDSITEALVASGADTLAVADPTIFPGSALRTLGWELEGTGVDLIVVPAITEVAGPRISIRPVAGVPMVHVEEPSLSGSARVVKSGFDRVFAALAAILLAPVLLAIAVTIRCTSRGPVLFRQTRVGRGGAEFQMLKFRTMVDGADQRMAEVRPLAPDSEHVLFKLPEDPRRTRVGRWLRKHSLDELPQLWNVLTGTMSVVGPRPPLPEEVARYASPVHRRLLVKPGLTGLWQVSGRADLSWDDAVRLDLYYVENWSWVLDALILVRTVPAVVRGRGAY
jgi:exopolysaccharide biosynthesis polyprenyl glycosylphosphotransferase